MRVPMSSVAAAGRAGALLVIVGAIMVAALGFGAGALMTGAQSSESIRGCVNSYTGALRILSSHAQCSQAERPLSWNSIPDGRVVLDRIQVTDTVRIETADQTSTVLARATCPAGYQIVTGGAEPSRSATTGDDPFYLMTSRPIYGDVGGPHGWMSEFKTVDGENAEGNYGFTVYAVCEKLSS